MSRYNAVLNRCLVNQTTEFILPCDSITVLGSVEGRTVSRITCNSNYCRIPACKSIGVLRGILFNRISMSRYNAVLNRCLVNQTTEFILPCDSITVLGSVEGCTVCCISSYGDYCRSPICKGVSIFCCRFFCRLSRCNRGLTILIDITANLISVFIQKFNRIGPDCRCISCGVCCVLRNFNNNRKPTIE